MKAAVEPELRGDDGTHARAFDGLFRGMLAARPELAATLRELGYDPAQPASVYPSSVWVNCIEAARRALFADRTPAEGMRALGKIFAEGIIATPVGQAYSGVNFSAVDYLRRVPSFVQRVRLDVAVSSTEEAPRRWRVLFRGPHQTPDFLAGIVETRLRERQIVPTIELQASDTLTEMRITW